MTEFFVSVKVEGQEVRDVLDAVELEESDSQAGLACLRFGDSDVVLGDVLQEGLTVEIDLGAADAHAVVFRGVITGLDVRFPGQTAAQVEVRALDNLVLLGFEPRTRRWWNTTLSQIVSEVATRYSLRPGTISPAQDDTIPEERPLQQVEETDLAFLRRLAARDGSRVFIDHPTGGDTLNVVSIRSLLTAAPLEPPLRFNDTMEEFSAHFEAFATDPAEAVVTTDPASGEPVQIVEEALATSADAAWTPDPSRIAALGDGAAGLVALAARAALKRTRLREFWRVPPRQAGAPARPSSDRSGTHGDAARRLGQVGRGRTSGNAQLRPRRRVRLEGFGGRWSGTWYLARVSHHVDLRRRRYTSSFLATR